MEQQKSTYYIVEDSELLELLAMYIFWTTNVSMKTARETARQRLERYDKVEK